MVSRPSISIKNNQNWLLSYTDLFLLVLSFFVLRFSVLKYDIKPLQNHIQETAIKEEHKLNFKVAPSELENKEVSLQTSISPDWFSISGLCTRGEREISILGNKIEGSKKTASLKLHKTKESEQEETNRQINLLIENLKAMGLISLKIEMVLKEEIICGASIARHGIACLVLDY